MPSDATQSDLRASLEEERGSLRAQLAELGFGENGGLDYDQNFADSSQVTAERGEATRRRSSSTRAVADCHDRGRGGSSAATARRWASADG